jgi:translocation and assembly module TamB
MKIKFLDKLFRDKRTRRFSIISAVILISAIAFFLLRGPHLSNAIKRIILPVLEEATGERIIIDKAVINLFPFYLQARRFKVFNDEGTRLLWIRKTRAYIDLAGLLSGEVRIRRLIITDPELTADLKELEKVGDSIDKKARGSNGKKFRVKLKSTKIMNGRFRVTNKEEKSSAFGRGLHVEMIMKDRAYADFLLENGSLKMPGLHELKGKIEGKLEADDKKIRIVKVRVISSDSSLDAAGEIFRSPSLKAKKGHLSGEARILAKSIGNIFGLKQVKEGELTVTGTVDLVPAKGFQHGPERTQVKLDLKTKGQFYLETLMDLVKVDENIKGRIALEGEIHGVYPHITGRGTLNADNVVLDTLPLDDVQGNLLYGNKKFRLENFAAHTYRGELNGSASLLIPGGRYIVDASVVNIDSPQFFQFIEWEPPFPAGKVSGTFSLDKSPDSDIIIDANVEYVNTTGNKGNLLADRLRNIEAEITLHEGILDFSNSALYTAHSSLYLEGSIDLHDRELNLDLEMDSKDAVDLTSPFYDGLLAPVEFRGKAAGSFQSSEITGSFKIGPGTLNGESFTEAAGDFVYDPETLTLELLRATQGKAIYEVSGSINFRESKGFFSFDSPFYRAEASIKNGNARSIIRAAYKEMPFAGIVNGNISFHGDADEFKGKGDLTLKEGVIYGQKIDQISMNAELLSEGIYFPSIEMMQGESNLQSRGYLYFDKTFDVEILSNSINSKDIKLFDDYPVDARFALDLKGSGTLENPGVTFSANVLESYFRGVSMGEGQLDGGLENNLFSVRGEILNGRAVMKADMTLTRELPWNVSIDLKRDKYHFLLAGLLENVPEDSSTSLEGTIRISGEGEKISLHSRLSSFGFNLYGYTFTSKDDIVFSLVDRELSIQSLSLRGKDGDINTTGVIRIGENYDVTMDGTINLTPLKAVSSDIETLKGEGTFSVVLSGLWESPELRGEINISDGSLLLSDFPYRIGPVNGDIFLDRDRVTFDSFSTDFAGGKIYLSGVGYLKKLSMKKLSLFSKLEGITIRPAEGLNVAFDGDLFFETSPQLQSLLGDIQIREARYTKRFDWKSGLLKLKQVSTAPVGHQPSFFDRTELNVYIKGENDIIVDNNIAQTPVKIDLNVRGSAAHYGLIGRVEAKGGDIFFRGNEFEIIHGSVDFVESTRIVPVFHIESEAFLRGYRVRLNLDGPVDEFTLTLFSDPQLSDSDILVLLTSGNITEGTEGIEGGIGAGEATAFLTGQLQDVLEERFKYITGFERFEVDPYTTSAGAISSRVTVGKEMLDKKLFVTYSSSLGSTELDVIKLQYNLTDNFSLIGLRDQLGSIGGDVRYRFEFK